MACGLLLTQKSNESTCGRLKMKSDSQELRGARTCIRRVDEVRSDRVVKTIFVYRLKPVDGDAPFYVRKLMG